MKQDLARVVRREFEAEMKRNCPSFVLRRDIRLPGGDLAFVAQQESGLASFVILELNQDWDAFNVDLAWNATSDELPRILGMLPSDPPFARQHRFPLHRLIDPSQSQHPWHWQVAPIPALSDVESWTRPKIDEPAHLNRARQLARDAVQQVVAVGLPYFNVMANKVRLGEI
jgi:hypothetical protein